MPKILFKNKSCIIALKPVGMPSQSDESGDTDLLSVIGADLRAKGEQDTLYPVHRLDRNVGGLIIVARTKSAAATLSAMVASDGIGKQYLAVAKGNALQGELCDYLLKDARASRAVVTVKGARGAKLARLHCTPLAQVTDGTSSLTLIRVRLFTGRFHQIRAQLSNAGTPLVGDKKYGGISTLRRTPALFAYKLDLVLDGERISAEHLPQLNEYPWNLFDRNSYLTADMA